MRIMRWQKNMLTSNQLTSNKRHLNATLLILKPFRVTPGVPSIKESGIQIKLPLLNIYRKLILKSVGSGFDSCKFETSIFTFSV